MWCGLFSRRIIGPYFFQSGRGARSVVQTVTGVRYRAMLESFVLPELRRQHYPISRLWFQQDGATPHTTRGVLAFLAGAFPGKVISKKGDVPWPPRSPDLSPLDFFLGPPQGPGVRPTRTLPPEPERADYPGHPTAPHPLSQGSPGTASPPSPLVPAPPRPTDGGDATPLKQLVCPINSQVMPG